MQISKQTELKLMDEKSKALLILVDYYIYYFYDFCI